MHLSGGHGVSRNSRKLKGLDYYHFKAWHKTYQFGYDCSLFYPMSEEAGLLSQIITSPSYNEEPMGDTQSVHRAVQSDFHGHAKVRLCRTETS